jgi:hypothetical protein
VSADEPVTSTPASALARAMKARIPIGWMQLGILAVLLFVVPFGKQTDPDFWWHLRTGELIFEDGFQRQDSFSWTRAGDHWVTHEWLAESIIYAVEATAGYAGNLLLFGVLTLSALGLMIAIARRESASMRVIVLLAALSAGMLGSFVSVRPVAFTWLMFSVFFFVLSIEKTNGRLLWLLPPLMAVWVNLHLGYVYGLMLLALWLASLLVEHVRGTRSMTPVPILVAAGCVVATLLNPVGPEILVYPIRYYFEGTSDRELIAEWQRPDLLSMPMSPLVIALAVLVAVTLAGTRPRIFHLLVAAAAVILALQAARNVPFVALILIPIAAPAITRRWPGHMLLRPSRTTVRTPVALCALVALGIAFALVAGVATGARAFARPSETGYPSGGAAYIRDELPGRRLFNDYAWGGYLAYELRGTPTFIDGRADFFGNQILQDYATIGRAGPGWDELLDAYGVEVVLTRRNFTLAGALLRHGDWEEVYVGRVERVFTRR